MHRRGIIRHPPDVLFGPEFEAAEDAMRKLEREIDSAIERQETLVANLELRATLLRVKIRDGGAT